MPELPEVETVKKTLAPKIMGRTITKVTVLWDKIVEDDTKSFVKKLTGAQFLGMARRGKFLIFHLDVADLVSHLRMEGKYQVVARTLPLDKHTHVIFDLDNGEQLRYLDIRKFGRMALMPAGQGTSYPGIKKLGAEPTEATFDLATFAAKLKKSHKVIKTLLLDQTVVAGIGNIYADEILFRAKIHPLTPANVLTAAEVATLRRDIIEILAQATVDGGTTIRTFENAEGQSGHHQGALTVYDRQGEPCVVCQTTIEKIVVGGRGTHFCPHCQVVEHAHD